MHEHGLDLEQCTPWLQRRIRRPGPVRDFRALDGGCRLVLRWSAPRGSRVTGYRIDRTREGRDYETVTETALTSEHLLPSPVNDPWAMTTAEPPALCAGWFCRSATEPTAGPPARRGLVLSQRDKTHHLVPASSNRTRSTAIGRPGNNVSPPLP